MGAPGLLRAFQMLIIGGIVLLTVSVVGLAASSGYRPDVETSPSRSLKTYVSPPIFTVFLVNTREDAEALDEREAQLARERELEGFRRRWRYQVLVAGNVVDEYIALNELSEIQSRWHQVGATGLEVIDLR